MVVTIFLKLITFSSSIGTLREPVQSDSLKLLFSSKHIFLYDIMFMWALQQEIQDFAVLKLSRRCKRSLKVDAWWSIVTSPCADSCDRCAGQQWNLSLHHLDTEKKVEQTFVLLV